jgi:outer membrane protein assembly factor BamB
MKRLLLAFMMISLGACSSSGPVHPPTELKSLKSELAVSQGWSVFAPQGDLDVVYSALEPVLDENIIFTANSDGVLQALDRSNGRRIWQQKLKTVVSGGVGENQELLFVGTANAEVIALDKRDGAIKWRVGVATEILTPPVASASHVIVRCGDGKVLALSTENGHQLWRLDRSEPALTLRGIGKPVIAGDSVLLGMDDGHLLALRLYDGSVTWDVTLNIPKGRTDLERLVDIDATPVVVGNTIFAAAYQGKVVAMALDTGHTLWARDFGSSAGLVVDRDNVYVVDDQDLVWALDQRSGGTLWKQDQLKYRGLSTPAMIDNAILVTDFEGYLHWIAREDGRMLARYQTNERGLRAGTKVDAGKTYVRSALGEFYELKLRKTEPMSNAGLFWFSEF